MSRGLYRTLLIIVTILCVLAGSAFNITRIFFRAVSRLIPFADRLEEEFDDLDWIWTIRNNDIVENWGDAGDYIHEEWDEEYYDFANIDMDVELAEVKIVGGDEYAIKYVGNELLKPELSIDDDTLTIRQSPGMRRGWSLNSVTCELTITVPEEKLDSVKLDVNAGDIDVQDLKVDRLEIDADAGDIDVSNVETDKLELDVNAGDVKLSDIVADDMEIEVDAGDLNLSDMAIWKGAVTLHMGDFDFTNGTFVDLTVDANMGDVRIDTTNDLSGYDVDLSCDMGEVRYNGKSKGTSYSHDGEGGSLSANCNMGEVRVNGK